MRSTSLSTTSILHQRQLSNNSSCCENSFRHHTLTHCLCPAVDFTCSQPILSVVGRGNAVYCPWRIGSVVWWKLGMLLLCIINSVGRIRVINSLPFIQSTTLALVSISRSTATLPPPPSRWII